jgi:hypothetical protein
MCGQSAVITINSIYIIYSIYINIKEGDYLLRYVFSFEYIQYLQAH